MNYPLTLLEVIHARIDEPITKYKLSDLVNFLQREPVHLGELLGLVEPFPPQQPRKSSLGTALTDASDSEASYEPVT